MKVTREIIKEALMEVLNEGRFDTTATPHNSHTDVGRNLGHNPLYADNGGHAAGDTVSQVSTFDTNGQNFKSNGNDIVLSDNKFIIYKIKNFGNDKIESTLSLFGRGAGGEKELRRAIDTINGAAKRNGRSVSYRTITCISFQNTSKRSGQMSKTFWEYSLDNGSNWYILKPNPVQSMQPSKLVMRTTEDIHRINEAKDATFSLDELSSIPNFNQKLNYCRQHLGKAIGNGSSRIVFQLNDQTCLKLAKNEAGVAQNQTESEYYKQTFECFPKIYDGDDENDTWLVCECVLPAKEQDFKHCLGMSFDEYCMFVAKCHSQYARRTPYPRIDDDKFNMLVESDEWFYDVYKYMSDYQPPIGDLTVIRNYGMVRRYNKDMIVILDHGLSEDIWNQYYKR